MSEVAVESQGAASAGPTGPRGYATQADGTRVPFCSYRKSDECESECGVVSLDGVGISNMELGPKRCARCEWVHSTKNEFSLKRPSLDEADPNSGTCGPGGFSLEEGIFWGSAKEKCCYPDICFPEAMPCVDEDEYRYGAYFGETAPGSTRNHGPDGYVPPTRHRAGGHVGVNNAWRHVDTQAGVDAVHEPLEPIYPMDPPPRPRPIPMEGQHTQPTHQMDRPCAFEAGLLDSCLATKPVDECRGYLEILRRCQQ